MSPRVASALLTALLAVPLAGVPDAARAAEFSRGDLNAQLDGQLRSLFTFTRELDPERLFLERSTRLRDAGLWLMRARLNADGVWKDSLYGQVTYDHELRTGSALQALPFRVAEVSDTGTWLDADRAISRHHDGQWRHSLYRAWLRYEREDFEITVGRQRIPLGRGRLWNPIDLFNQIPPLAIEGTQRIGEDAVRARLRVAKGAWAGFIWAPQDDPDDHKLAVRGEISRRDFDAAAMVARIGKDWVFGADFALNLGDAAGRAEATYTDLELGGRVWQVVASVDYTFQVGDGLYALVEHFYNENRVRPGGVEALALLAPDVETGIDLVASATQAFRRRLTTIARDQTGFQLSYEFTPLWRGNLVWFYDWDGPSGAIAPALTWAPRSDLEFTFAGQLYIGRDGRSEYGDRPNVLILSADFYF